MPCFPFFQQERNGETHKLTTTRALAHAEIYPTAVDHHFYKQGRTCRQDFNPNQTEKHEGAPGIIDRHKTRGFSVFPNSVSCFRHVQVPIWTGQETRSPPATPTLHSLDDFLPTRVSGHCAHEQLLVTVHQHNLTTHEHTHTITHNHTRGGGKGARRRRGELQCKNQAGP